MSEMNEQALRSAFFKLIQQRFVLDLKSLRCNAYLTGRGGRNDEIHQLLKVYEQPWLIETMPEVARMVEELHSMITPEKREPEEFDQTTQPNA